MAKNRFDALDASALCRRCGLKGPTHADASECIGALRELVGMLQARLDFLSRPSRAPRANGRTAREIPRYVAG